MATFAFASQENPSPLTVSMFGGSGFVSLGAGFGGIQTLQAEFAFTGQFAFDIGVANGGLSILAGIYFKYTKPSGGTGGASLTGFVRITGQLEVLGLILISAELDLSLTWEISAGVVQGTATLRAHVAVCGFGVTVPITMSKSFGGSSTARKPPPLAAGNRTKTMDRATVVEATTPRPFSGTGREDRTTSCWWIG